MTGEQQRSRRRQRREGPRAGAGRVRLAGSRAAAFLLLPALGACSDFFLRSQDPIVEEAVVVEERFVQLGLPELDLLFVLDDTSSMAAEQVRLLEALEGLPELLDAAGLSWHVGVVSMDLSQDEAGLLQGDPWIITPELADPDAALVEAADLGAEGLPPEAGLAAAVAALSEPLRSGGNRAFRRPSAALHVVVVSDADDDSTDYLDDPAGEIEALLAAEEAASGQPARLSAVVGPEPSGCNGEDGSTATAGSTYLEVAEATGGTTESICEVDFGPVLEAIGDLPVSWPDTFPLQAAPVPETVRVSVDGVRVDEGWTLSEEPWAVVFEIAPEPGAELAVRYEVAG